MFDSFNDVIMYSVTINSLIAGMDVTCF